METKPNRSTVLEAGTFRDYFDLPLDVRGNPVTYLCSHSLGPMPKAARTIVNEELGEWSRLAVLGHTDARHPWIEYQKQLTGTIANLAGATERETTVMHTLTTNLHLLMVSFYRPEKERRAILIEENAFPSDRYAIESQILFHGGNPDKDLITVPASAGKETIDIEDIEAAVLKNSKRLALILWPGIQYLTGQLFDMKKISELGHSVGAMVGFDLAHAIGNVPLSMHDSGADFAVWCGYKYLCGGPGATGGCFVHSRHVESYYGPRFSGWWGNKENTKFKMLKRFDPIDGAAGWQLSTPTILAMSPLVASLNIFSQVGVSALYQETMKLTRTFVDALRAIKCPEVPMEVITPVLENEHGSQISVSFPEKREHGRKIFKRLLDNDIIVDWREPNVIRFSICPLYNTVTECMKAADTLAEAQFDAAKP